MPGFIFNWTETVSPASLVSVIILFMSVHKLKAGLVQMFAASLPSIDWFFSLVSGHRDAGHKTLSHTDL